MKRGEIWFSAVVPFDWGAVGLERECVIACDGVHTLQQKDLTALVGDVADATMERVCSALS